MENISVVKYLRLPYSLYTMNNQNLGYVENYIDKDGTIREYRPMVKVGERIVPSLGLSAYLVAKDYSQLPKFNLTSQGTFKLKWYGEGGVHTDEKGELIKASTFDYYSAYYIFESARQELILSKKADLKKELIKDRVFFVGNISRALLDQKNTPFTAVDSVYPGVEIHATSYINMLYNDYMKTPLLFLEILLYLIPIFLISLAGLRTESVKLHSLVVTVIILAVFLIHIFLFSQFNFISNTTYFLLLTLTSFISALIFNYILVGRNRNLIKSALGMYISPALEREITQSGKPIGVTGEEVEATAMFIDIAGFTTFSEKHSADKVVQILNVYLNEYCDFVMDNSGFINKFLGDGLMALYGTLLPCRIC